MSRLSAVGSPFDLFQDSSRKDSSTSPIVKPAVLYPQFNPPLRPLPPSFSYRKWFRRVFCASGDFLHSPFDVEGEKPQCYALHATTIEIESPPFSPEQVSRLVTERSRPDDPATLRVYRITPDMMAKRYESTDACITEALNQYMVATMTTIPVPEVRGIAVYPDAVFTMTYLVMEYIDGQTLDSCWNELSLLSKLRIAWTLRDYVGQLRCLRRTVPGTLNGSLCIGALFTEYGAGPFASYDEMTAWFNHKLEVSQRMQKAPLDAPRFNTSSPLVFTHFDLCPRNVLLGRDGKVYLLDWERSGFYPEWFGYVGMRSDRHFKSRLWDCLIPWISHSVFPATRKRIEENWRNIGWALLVGFLM